MKKKDNILFMGLPNFEKLLVILTLSFSWIGVLIAFWLIFLGYFNEPGFLIWSQVIASCSLAALALHRPKKDIVSILTPVYAVLIFFTLDIPKNMFLMFLYALTLTVILIRLERMYGYTGSIQHV